MIVVKFEISSVSDITLIDNVDIMLINMSVMIEVSKFMLVVDFIVRHVKPDSDHFIGYCVISTITQSKKLTYKFIARNNINFVACPVGFVKSK